MRILALSPHMDDTEFGCGATLRRLAAEGNEIFQVAFSRNAGARSAGIPDGQAMQAIGVMFTRPGIRGGV